jgi:hypothetical protein
VHDPDNKLPRACAYLRPSSLNAEQVAREAYRMRYRARAKVFEIIDAVSV